MTKFAWERVGNVEVGSDARGPACVVAPLPDYAPHAWRFFAYKRFWKRYVRPTRDFMTASEGRSWAETYFASHFIVWC